MHDPAAEAVWDARRSAGVELLTPALALPPSPVRTFILGWIANLDGRTDEALNLLREAERDLPRDDLWRARALRTLGDVLGDVGDDLAAEQNYVEAMRLFDLHGDVHGKVSTLQNSSALGYHSPDTATARLREALALATPLGDPELTAIILTNLGEMTSAGGHLDEARTWMVQATDLLADTSADLRARAVSILAKIEFEQGNPEAAARLLETIDPDADEYYAPTRIHLARQLGRLECLRGHPEDAIAMLGAQLKPQMHPLMELPLQEGLSEAHEEAGDLRSALAAARRVAALHSHLQEDSATRRAAALDAWHSNEELRASNEWAQLHIHTLEEALEELRRARDAIHEMSVTDSLTGIHNRTHLIAAGPALLAEASTPHPAQIAVIDIDAFKTVNDTYGHAAGDSVLMAVAVLLTRHAHYTDLVCRHGGDEFIVLRPPVDTSSLAEDLRSACADMASSPITVPALPTGDQVVTVGLSVGVVEVAHPSLDAALAAADALMYEAKRTGGSRVVAGGSRSRVST